MRICNDGSWTEIKLKARQASLDLLYNARVGRHAMRLLEMARWAKVKLNIMQVCLENTQCLKFDQSYVIYSFWAGVLWEYVSNCIWFVRYHTKYIFSCKISLCDKILCIIYSLQFISTCIIPGVLLMVHVYGINSMFVEKHIHAYIHTYMWLIKFCFYKYLFFRVLSNNDLPPLLQSTVELVSQLLCETKSESTCRQYYYAFGN